VEKLAVTLARHHVAGHELSGDPRGRLVVGLESGRRRHGLQHEQVRYAVQGVHDVEPPAARHAVRERRDGVGGGRQQALQHGRAARGILREKQRRGPRDVRRRHGRAAEILVARRIAAAGVARRRHRREDAHARRAEVHRARPVVREGRQVVGCVGGRDAHDVGQRVAGGIERRGVVVARVVPGRRDEQHAGGVGGGDRVGERLRILAAAPAVVHHPRAHIGGVDDGVDGVRGEAEAVRPDEFHAHQAHVPVHPGDADAVVAGRADGSRDVRAVAVVVRGIGVAVVEIVAVDVVDVAVAVVVDAVAGDLARVDPDVRGEVRMRAVDPRVDHRDDDLVAAGGGVPGLGRVDVGAGDAACLPDVVQAPERAELRVVRNAVDRDLEVRLDELDQAALHQLVQHRADALAPVQRDVPPPADRSVGDPARRLEAPRLGEAVRREMRLHLVGEEAGLELDQQADDRRVPEVADLRLRRGSGADVQRNDDERRGDRRKRGAELAHLFLPADSGRLALY